MSCLLEKLTGEIETEFMEGHEKVVVTDLSAQALDLLKAQYGSNRTEAIPVISPGKSDDPNEITKKYNLTIYKEKK